MWFFSRKALPLCFRLREFSPYQAFQFFNIDASGERSAWEGRKVCCCVAGELRTAQTSRCPVACTFLRVCYDERCTPAAIWLTEDEAVPVLPKMVCLSFLSPCCTLSTVNRRGRGGARAAGCDAASSFHAFQLLRPF